MAGISKIKFLSNNKKIQFYRKDEFVDVSCPFTSGLCKWDCMFCSEPISEAGMTYLIFNCNSGGVQFAIPDADFVDERQK
jgi:hypothetical protein